MKISWVVHKKFTVIVKMRKKNYGGLAFLSKDDKIESKETDMSSRPFRFADRPWLQVLSTKTDECSDRGILGACTWLESCLSSKRTGAKF